MIRGLNIFKTYFKEFKDSYVLIGGSATTFNLSSSAVHSRSTKDLDIVIIAEVLDASFVNRLLEFVKDGEYKNQKQNGDLQFYRFDSPTNENFPYMLELFFSEEIKPETYDFHLASIHVDDDIQSLSGILLNKDYYNIMRKSIIYEDGISYLSKEALILFKAKAWLDLTEKKLQGKDVKSSDIKKHITDILLLTTILDTPTTNLPDKVMTDWKLFVSTYKKNPKSPKDYPTYPDLYILGIEDIIAKWEEIYF